MKRIITISIILLIVVGIFLTGAWLLSRKTAQKNGTTPQSFRDFVTGGTTTGSPTTTPGDLSSDFSQDGTPVSGTPSSGSSSGAQTNGTRTSLFTNGNLSPASSFGGGSLSPGGSSGGSSGSASGSGNPLNGGTPQDGGTIPVGTPPIAPGTTTSTAPECTDADLNITFTAEELQKLQALQDRFYEIAQTLHNDGDVQTQQANYTAFTLKQQNLNGLLEYCTALTPNIPATAALKNRVPTPFWYELGDIRSNPTFSFLPGSLTPARRTGADRPPLGYVMGPGQIGGHVTGWRDGGSLIFIRSMERLLRLSLW